MSDWKLEVISRNTKTDSEQITPLYQIRIRDTEQFDCIEFGGKHQNKWILPDRNRNIWKNDGPKIQQQKSNQENFK